MGAFGTVTPDTGKEKGNQYLAPGGAICIHEENQENKKNTLLVLGVNGS
jgi:hypothetical protein